MRQRYKKWAVGFLENAENVIKDPYKHIGKWGEFFGNSNPIYLEIGCGKGKFIREHAQKNPSINYIAIERERNVICTAARDAGDDLKNLVFLNVDVENLLEIFAENEIDRLYINFCDPWMRKKKWTKRRLTHTNFLNVYRKVLKPKAIIEFKTDNEPLFDFSIEEFTKNDYVIKDKTYDLQTDNFKENVTTEFEEKYKLSDIKIKRLVAINPKIN